MTDTKRAFEELQEKLVGLWPAIGAPTDEHKTMVVVPSISMEVPAGITPLLPAYEERYLFLLLLLRQPQAHVIYVTSQPVLPRLIDYYLGLLPEEERGSARDRLVMVSLGDPSPRPLTEKLLERPRSLQRVIDNIPDIERAHLVFFTTSPLEEELALRLGIPMYGAAVDVLHLGTKRGSRRAFAEASVPHPRGAEVHSYEDVVEAIRLLHREIEGLSQVMVKLDLGIGGLGNGVVDVTSASTGDDIERCVRALQIEGEAGGFDHFFAELARQGGIVEERIVAAEVRSPSVQLRIAPNGEAELLSTHDQILGGPTGQAFYGSRFPADPAYASRIADEARKVGALLAAKGVLGRFAVDFVVTHSGGMWDVYAIEINLRKGGTTHPFLTMQLLTNGSYDAAEARFRCATGDKFYVASDHLEGDSYSRMTPDDLLDVVASSDLGWDNGNERGAVFHMISALPVEGRIGVTAIADSVAEADVLFERVQASLERAAKAADV